MRRRLNMGWTLAMAAVLLAAVALATGKTPDEPLHQATASAPAPGGDAAATSGDTAPGSAGLRVYLDPETGLLRNRPTEEDPGLSRRLEDRLNTYGGDLLQERIPQGGFKVDLRGRFRSAVVATIDPVTDEVTIDCVSTGASGEVRHDG